MTKFRCTVHGIPATQGSMKGFVIPAKGERKARAIVTHGRGSKIVVWRGIMEAAFRRETAQRGPFCPGHELPLFTGAVCVIAQIILPRLASHPKTSKGKPVGWPVGKSDLDKHCRAIGDALTAGQVVQDDGLICQWAASKRYAEIDEYPGVVVEVTEL